MKNEFIPYEEAIALKELGYKEDYKNGLNHFGMYCEGEFYLLYRNMGNDIPDHIYREVDTPLYQQAFRWFREKYNKLHTVNIDLSNNLKDKVYIYTIEDHLGSIVDRSEEYNTYEEAELACLRKLIKIVENENK